jgi:hypothetical protein
MLMCQQSFAHVMCTPSNSSISAFVFRFVIFLKRKKDHPLLDM